MIVGRPAYRYPIAVVPPPAEVAPLLQAIRECEARPFRIISYLEDSGKVFNCSFFDDRVHMREWLSWLATNALSADSRFHKCMARAVADADALPTAETLLFAHGTTVLADTRLGEYHPGMAINFTRQVPRGAEQHVDVCEVAASAEFEQRIAEVMQQHGIAYFGRLAMLEGAEDAEDAAAVGRPPPALVTAIRYGSLDDAKRGTALVRELMRPELTRWFDNQYNSLLGTTTQVLEL